MIGILCNTLSIIFGGTVGHLFGKRMGDMKGIQQMLGIALMLLSLLSMIPQAFSVENGALQSVDVILIVGCLILGSLLGEGAARLVGGKWKSLFAGIQGELGQGIYAGSMLFGIGGLQFIGAINAVVAGDSTVLFSKCMVDLPLAISFGAMMGMGIAMSGVIVGLSQLVIGGIAYLLRGLFTVEVIGSLCIMGYVMLFFVGFNMVFEGVVKIRTNQMLPSLLLILLYHTVRNVIPLF